MADVRMPDGQIVTNVPDDMDPDELLKNYSSHLATQPKQKESSVWEAVKQGAKQAFSPEAITEYGKQIPPGAAARMAAPINMAAGMARIPANLMSWAGINEPKEAINAAQEGAKNLTESAGYTGMRPGLSNLGGEVALGGAALKLASKAAPAIEAMGGANLVKSLKKDPLSQAVLGSAALGAAGSTGTAYDASKEALLGGAFGAAGHGIASGVGHVAAPQLARYKALKDAGYTDEQILKDTSIGQFFGGIPQKIENVLKDIPLGGVVPKVEAGIKSLKQSLLGKTEPILEQSKTAQNILGTSQKQAQTLEQRALDKTTDITNLEMNARHAAEVAAHKATGADVHIPALNYALEPLGKTISPNKIGHDANNEMVGFIKDAYKESLGGMSTLRLSKPVQENLRSLKETWKGKLTPDVQELLSHDIERLIASTSKGKWLTPENWQNNLMDLSTDAYKMIQKEPRYGQALYELKDKWMDVIENQVGSELFKAANTAFSRSKIPEKAASYGKSIKAEGQVEPNELVNAARSELSTSRLAGGENKIQQMAVEANKKFLADKAAMEAKQSAEKLKTGNVAEQQKYALQDRYTGMENTLARQKAALQKQAEGNVGKHQELIDETIGPKTLGDYVGKRMAYGVGAGSLGMGSYGLSHILGIDPLYAAAIAGTTMGGTRGLYSKTAQDWLKQKALAPRSAPTQAVGEALQANAPVAGLTTVQERQRMAKEKEENTPIGALPVPQ